jgi:ribose transport system substrate-binding protein
MMSKEKKSQQQEDGQQGRGRRKSTRVLMLGGLSVITSLVMVACGSPSSNSSSTTGNRSNGKVVHTVSSSQLAKLKQVLTKAESIPTFKAPGPAINVSKAKGKTGVVFPSNSEISYCSTEATDITKLSNSLGMKFTNFSTTGQPSQWVQGALQAVSTHSNALAMLCGVPVTALKPQLLKAKQKGVMAIEDQQYDPSLPVPSSVKAATSIPMLQAMRTLADDAIVTNGGKSFHTLVLTSNDINSGPPSAKAIQNEFKKVYGTDAGVKVDNIPIADWSTRIQSTVSSALQSDPKITAIIAVYDGMTPNVVPAIQASKRTNVKIYTYGAGPGVMKEMQKQKSIYAADIGPNVKWAAYALVDQVLRTVTGANPAPPKKELVPLRLWTQSNISKYFGPNGGFGTDFISGYKNLWHAK